MTMCWASAALLKELRLAWTHRRRRGAVFLTPIDRVLQPGPWYVFAKIGSSPQCKILWAGLANQPLRCAPASGSDMIRQMGQGGGGVSLGANGAPLEAVSQNRTAQACSRRWRRPREATWTAPSPGLDAPCHLESSKSRGFLTEVSLAAPGALRRVGTDGVMVKALCQSGSCGRAAVAARAASSRHGRTIDEVRRPHPSSFRL